MSRSTAVRPPARRRTGVIVASVLGGVLVLAAAAATASAAVQALVVRDELLAVLPEIETMRASLDGPASPALDKAALADVGRAVDRAVQYTDRPDWWLAEHLPVVGANFEAVRTAAETASVVVHDVVGPVLELPLDGLASEGRLDLTKLSVLARTSARALEALDGQLVRLDRVDRTALLPQVSEALASVDGPLRKVAGLGTRVAPVLRALPAMLGEDGPRDVVLLFQNSAEARALGGISGASVLIRIEDGTVELARSLSGADFVGHAEPVVALPSDTDALYRSDGYPIAGTTIHEATSRPDFVYAAEVASALWSESQGVQPDLIIGIDPVALSYLLRAIDPVVLPDGATLTPETLVSQLLNEVYRVDGSLTDEANGAQDAYFTTVVEALVSALQSGGVDLPQLLGAWGQSAEERRVLAWSADRVEQRAILAAGIGGALPVTTSEQVPFGLYLADAVGSKLEYYLREEVRVSAGSCDVAGDRSVTVSSAFTNTIDREPGFESGEFDYIAGLYAREGLERGHMKLRVMLYVPERAQIASFRVDGVETAYAPGSDAGRPVAYAMITVPPGATVTVDADASVAGMGGRGVSFTGTPGVVQAAVENAVEACR